MSRGRSPAELAEVVATVRERAREADLLRFGLEEIERVGPQPGEDWGYGAGWWVMSGFDGVPDDAFAARGNRGQYVVVIPSLDMVIVRRGEDPAGGSGFDIAAFTRDVIAALEE